MDIGRKNKKITEFISIEKAQEASRLFCGSSIKRPNLISRGRRSYSFYTEDSKKYITPREYLLMEKGVVLDRGVGKWDSLSDRIVRNYRSYKPSQTDLLYRAMIRRTEAMSIDMKDASRSFLEQFSMIKLWNMSIVGAIIFGMFSMTMIYRYLGQGADAKENLLQSNQSIAEEMTLGEVRGTEDAADDNSDITRYTEEALYDLGNIDDQDKLEDQIRNMVKGYPIEKMVPYIAEQDRIVAAFLVGIAKKESNWGKRVPVLDGQDCYNYWGYRGQRKLMGSGGHTCFNSRKDAVETVAKRLKKLIEDEELNTPEKMVIWKCGSSCAATGGQAAANKWISDVDKYFRQLESSKN